MAITVGTVQAGTDATAETSAPSGTGGTLILPVRVESAITIGTPTGWTSRAAVADGNGGSGQRVLTRTSDGGANDTPTVDVSFCSNWQDVLIRDTGLDASPFDAANTGSVTNSGTINVPSITTAEANERIYVFATSSAGSVTGHPTGYTNLVEYEVSDGTLAVWYKDVGAAGSYGGETITFEFPFANLTVSVLALKTSGGTAPTITSGNGATATVYHPEGSATVLTATASGSPTPTWDLNGGTDAADFSIDSSSGVLSFSVTPDHDSPHDSDSNNVYEVVIRASNGVGSPDTQTVTVIVYPTHAGGLDAPLDTADCVYRYTSDFFAASPMYANRGTRDEPLILGNAVTADSQDPDWGTSGGLGHLSYTAAGAGSESTAYALLPQAVVDAANFTFACRMRLQRTGETQNVANIMRVNESDKTFFVHIDGSNKCVARVWSDVLDAQVVCESTTTFDTSTWHNIVVTWTNADLTLRLYIDGAEEDSAVSDSSRKLRGADGTLHLALIGSPPLSMVGQFRGHLWDTEAWDDAEVLALESNDDWMTDGAGAGAAVGCNLLRGSKLNRPCLVG